jgi:hypothetical protein
MQNNPNSQLESLLQRSQATHKFKQSVREIARGNPADCVSASPGSPPVKVLRVLMKCLEMYPQMPISQVDISAKSTCSAYSGHLIIQPGGQRIEFAWDCHWKAEQEGITAWYGGPDQSRAAQEFGYQCFKYFKSPATDPGP